jgi:SAM-dependent methyltransferase
LNDINSVVPVFGSNAARILDIGCGDLVLLRKLTSDYSRPETYFGVDLLPPVTANVEAMAPSGFVEGDVCHVKLPEGLKVNLVFSSNTLCYVPDLLPLMANIGPCLSDGGYWIVIEPFPSLFWETYFEGITLELRRPESLGAKLREGGWTEIGRSILFLRKIGPIGVWPVSYLSAYSRRWRER